MNKNKLFYFLNTLLLFCASLQAHSATFYCSKEIGINKQYALTVSSVPSDDGKSDGVLSLAEEVECKTGDQLKKCSVEVLDQIAKTGEICHVPTDTSNECSYDFRSNEVVVDCKNGVGFRFESNGQGAPGKITCLSHGTLVKEWNSPSCRLLNN